MDALPRQIVPVHEAHQQFQRMDQLKVQLGEVHGDRQDLVSVLQPLMQQAADVLDDVGIQLADKAHFLQKRHKLRRGDHTLFRVLPAGQRLKTAELSRQGPHYRLIVDMNIALCQGALEVVEQIGALFALLLHPAAVDRCILGGILADGVAGKSCPIQCCLQSVIVCPLLRQVDAGLELDALAANAVPDLLRHPPDAGLRLRSAHDRRKVVR